MAKDSTPCPICGWPYAFPELSVNEAYKKCIAIHCVDRSQAESNSQFHRVAGSPEEATSELERIGSRQIATNANQETRKKNERSKYSYMTFLDNLDISPTLKAILYEEYLKREAYWKSLLRNKKTGEEKT